MTGHQSARSVTKGLEAVKQSGERGLVVSSARATRGLLGNAASWRREGGQVRNENRPSLDAPSGRPTRLLSLEKERASSEGALREIQLTLSKPLHGPPQLISYLLNSTVRKLSTAPIFAWERSTSSRRFLYRFRPPAHSG